MISLRKYSVGFTLIELLIAVAIIGILAAIAVPNYLNAQIRSKVSRNMAEFKTLTTAIEVYSSDHNVAPRMAHWAFFGDENLDRIKGEKVSGVISSVISTPVAYITNAYLMDPFMASNEKAPIDERLYTYQSIATYQIKKPYSTFWGHASDYYGEWRLCGVGPDRVFDHGFSNSAQLPYDPTNGTVSKGNIWFSPKVKESSLPPIPTLLGNH